MSYRRRIFLRDTVPYRVRMRDAHDLCTHPFRRSKYWKGQTRRVRLAGCLRALVTYDSFSQRMPQIGRVPAWSER